jgi:biotin operon repressor
MSENSGDSAATSQQSSADTIDPVELESMESESSESSPVEQKVIEKLEREYLLKVNGKEVKSKIDLNDESRIRKALQMEAAAQEAFQSSAAAKKQLEQTNAEMNAFIERLKSNPLEILKHPELGINLEQIAELILQQKIEEEMKSPEQIELEKARKRLQELEDERTSLSKAKEKAEMERLEQEASQHIQNEIISAIDTGDLPNSPYIVNKMAQMLAVAFDNGIDVDAKDIVPLVKQAYLKDMRDMMGKLPDEVLEELVTPDRVKSIRNKRIQSVRSKNSQAVKVQDTGRRPEPKTDTKKPSPRDFWKSLGDDHF